RVRELFEADRERRQRQIHEAMRVAFDPLEDRSLPSIPPARAPIRSSLPPPRAPLWSASHDELASSGASAASSHDSSAPGLRDAGRASAPALGGARRAEAPGFGDPRRAATLPKAAREARMALPLPPRLPEEGRAGSEARVIARPLDAERSSVTIVAAPSA